MINENQGKRIFLRARNQESRVLRRHALRKELQEMTHSSE